MDYYGGGDSEPATEPSPEQDSPEKDSGKTFLLNKDVCPDMAPGSEGKFRVKRELESEYECEYIEDKKEESEPEPAMAEPSGGGGMSGMFE